MLNDLELTGRARSHVVQRDDLGVALHAAVVEPFLDLKADAARAGIDLAITSGFRDFGAQQRIWDLKFRGERPLYDSQGIEREHGALGPEALVEAILCWSALPGGSRHHWGSDLDVIDVAAMPEGYRVQLLPSEAAPGGVFHSLHMWLDRNMHRHGFFRPYRTSRGGVSPEPWHLSYAPIAVSALQALTPELLSAAIDASDMLGKDIVLGSIAAVHARYIANVDAPGVAGASVTV